MSYFVWVTGTTAAIPGSSTQDESGIQLTRKRPDSKNTPFKYTGWKRALTAKMTSLVSAIVRCDDAAVSLHVPDGRNKEVFEIADAVIPDHPMDVTDREQMVNGTSDMEQCAKEPFFINDVEQSGELGWSINRNNNHVDQDQTMNEEKLPGILDNVRMRNTFMMSQIGVSLELECQVWFSWRGWNATCASTPKERFRTVCVFARQGLQCRAEVSSACGTVAPPRLDTNG